MKICHAFISLRLSFVKVMRCVGFETDLVKSYTRRREQRPGVTTLQQKFKSPNSDCNSFSFILRLRAC